MRTASPGPGSAFGSGRVGYGGVGRHKWCDRAKSDDCHRSKTRCIDEQDREP